MESVQLVHDLGNVFEKVISPAVLEEAVSILDAVLMFVRFYEQNEHFNLLTHGVGPGVIAVVMHNFSNFLGDLMGQKLIHEQKYGGKRLFPTMYMDKLRSIVNSIVVDHTDEYTGKVLKAPQETKPITKTKKGKKTQGQDSKQQQQQQQLDDETSDDDIEIVSDAESCMTNENDFTTLTSGMGQAYHLPSRHTSKSRYRRSKGEKDATDDVIQRIKEMRHTLEKQKRQITKLTSQNNAAKQQMKQINERKAQPGVSGLKQSKMKLFISTQIWDSLNLDSSDEEEDNGAWKPDSTQQGATGSDGGSGHIPCSGVVHKKAKRKRIDSESQPLVKQDNTPMNISDDSETELIKLI